MIKPTKKVPPLSYWLRIRKDFILLAPILPFFFNIDPILKKNVLWNLSRPKPLLEQGYHTHTNTQAPLNSTLNLETSH